MPRVQGQAGEGENRWETLLRARAFQAKHISDVFVENQGERLRTKSAFLREEEGLELSTLLPSSAENTLVL